MAGFFQGSEVLIVGTFFPEMFQGSHYFIVYTLDSSSLLSFIVTQ